jgi:thiol-disulfide isomerase/thioredoxin
VAAIILFAALVALFLDHSNQVPTHVVAPAPNAPASVVKELANLALLPGAPTGSGTTKPSGTEPTSSFVPTLAWGTSGRPIPTRNLPELTSSGKPVILWVGAQFCPSCLAETWPLVMALSRFGRFVKLGQGTSSSHEAFRDVPGFDFAGTDYVSRYFLFDHVETYASHVSPTGVFPALEIPGPTVTSLVHRLDNLPYTSLDGVLPGTLPLVDFANRFVSIGSPIPPGLLSTMSLSGVANSLANPESPISLSIKHAAASITASLCVITGSRPHSVCAMKSAR